MTSTLSTPDVTKPWTAAAVGSDTSAPGPRPVPPQPVPPQMVVVDLETSGRDPLRHEIVEVAWWNLTTGERDNFVPHHRADHMICSADLDALRINRYVERELWKRADTDDPHGHRMDRLYDQLASDHDQRRATGVADRPRGLLCGHNPWFDARFLAAAVGGEPWNYRLRDVGNYGAGVLGHRPDCPLTLNRLCDALGVDRGDHTAAGDVTATGTCLLKLAELSERITWAPVVHFVTRTPR